MKNHLLLFLFTTTMSIIINMGFSVAATKRPFTFVDGFNQTQLFDIRPRRQETESAKRFLFSSDGKKLFLITGRGDAERKTYQFSLLMYDTDAIMSYLNGVSTTPPVPKTIASFDDTRKTIWDTIHESTGIKNVTAIDDNLLLFIATDVNDTHQLFSVDLKNGQIRQLTSQAYRVTDYTILKDRNEVLFTTPDPTPRSKHCKKISFPVREMSIYDAICFRDGLSYYETRDRNDPRPDVANLYKLALKPGAKPVQIASGISLYSQLADIVLSPSGKSGVLRLWSKKAPASLEKAYQASHFYQEDLKPYVGFDPDVAKTGYSMTAFRYFGLINFDDNRIVPVHEFLLPKQGGTYLGEIPPASQPVWLAENQLYLPDVEWLGPYTGNGDGGAQELTRRGDFTVKITGDTYHASMADNLLPVHLAATSAPTLTSASAAQEEDITQRCIDFVRLKNMPQDNLPMCYVEHARLGLRLVLDQNFDRPPTLIAEDIKTSRQKTLMRLNPQFDQLAFGKVEILSWKDDNGLKWTGGLVLPPDFKPGRRYPLVIQPGYFPSYRFLIDGTVFDAPPYAAQALANKNIIVLQVEISQRGTRYDDERQAIINSLDKAIDILHQRGFIDTRRIGMTGFSAMGRLTFSMAIFSKYQLAAVIISDSASPTITGYTFAHGVSYPGMLDVEWAMCDSKPWGSGISNWVRQNPFFHLDSLKTAVLITTSEAGITDWWDAYAGMRRLKKPVELHYNTSGGHPIIRPDAALADYDLTVDWYDFWLNNRESSASEKVERYEYWRELRRRKQITETTSPAAPPLRAMTCS